MAFKTIQRSSIGLIEVRILSQSFNDANTRGEQVAPTRLKLKELELSAEKQSDSHRIKFKEENGSQHITMAVLDAGEKQQEVTHKAFSDLISKLKEKDIKSVTVDMSGQKQETARAIFYALCALSREGKGDGIQFDLVAPDDCSAACINDELNGQHYCKNFQVPHNIQL